jgi:hypothetical protein
MFIHIKKKEKGTIDFSPKITDKYFLMQYKVSAI